MVILFKTEMFVWDFLACDYRLSIFSFSDIAPKVAKA